MTLILHCIGVVTSIVIFPFGIMVLIFYFCGHKCSGNENTEGMERNGRKCKLGYAGMKKIDEEWEESASLTYFKALFVVQSMKHAKYRHFRKLTFDTVYLESRIGFNNNIQWNLS